MNKEYFHPHGLYWIIMTYPPGSASAQEAIDITQTISSSLPTTAHEGARGFQQRLKASLRNPTCGGTHGEF